MRLVDLFKKTYSDIVLPSPVMCEHVAGAQRFTTQDDYGYRVAPLWQKFCAKCNACLGPFPEGWNESGYEPGE